MFILANMSFAVEVHVVGVIDYGKGARNPIFWPCYESEYEDQFLSTYGIHS